ncbi:hypothetical protein TNCV_2383431 [Trichonephila clavipes]|nr:hypothetical protein TNCV_2383431 [Trichonephila clavipes]
MASAECMGGPRAPPPLKSSAGCSVYRQCVLEGVGVEVKSNTTPNQNTGCRTSIGIPHSKPSHDATDLSQIRHI